MDKRKIYCCYSVPLMKFLTESNNITYDVVGLNPNSHKTFWGFIKTTELEEALKRWKK
jgi:hypothetical protein